MTTRAAQNSERFTANALTELDAAIQARSKAIRYKTKSMSVHRELSRTATEEEERLVLEVNTLEPRPTNVRLQVWPDGAMWFGAFKPAKSGWAFELAFNGYLSGMTNDVVVVKFEKSLEHLSEPDNTSETRELVLAIWEHVQPVVQDAT